MFSFVMTLVSRRHSSSPIVSHCVSANIINVYCLNTTNKLIKNSASHEMECLLMSIIMIECDFNRIQQNLIHLAFGSLFGHQIGFYCNVSYE